MRNSHYCATRFAVDQRLVAQVLAEMATDIEVGFWAASRVITSPHESHHRRCREQQLQIDTLLNAKSRAGEEHRDIPDPSAHSYRLLSRQGEVQGVCSFRRATVSRKRPSPETQPDQSRASPPLRKSSHTSKLLGLPHKQPRTHPPRCQRCGRVANH